MSSGPTTQSAPSTAGAASFGQRAGNVLTRGLLGLAGLGLLVGFFMPWLVLGHVAALSGFSLMVTRGEVVEMISGSHRVMLFAVPLLGVVLLAGAFFGHRSMVWIGTISGVCLLVFGLFTLISLFFATTGLGMWVVVFSAFLALGVGLVGIGKRRRGPTAPQ
jgi:hypothetical protein